MVGVEDKVGVGSGWRSRGCPNKEEAIRLAHNDVFARRNFRFHTHTSTGPVYPYPILDHTRKCSRYT